MMRVIGGCGAASFLEKRRRELIVPCRTEGLAAEGMRCAADPRFA
jgi:hypothetical protein